MHWVINTIGTRNVMACNKETCKTCLQIRKFRHFRDLLPEDEQEFFCEWFDEMYGDLENAQMDLATNTPEWRQDNPQYRDESKRAYEARIADWNEIQLSKGVS